MRRAEQKFKSVENKYCCSEHFVPNDYRISLTGHRKDLKTVAMPSNFPGSSAESHVREERLRLRILLISYVLQRSNKAE